MCCVACTLTKHKSLPTRQCRRRATKNRQVGAGDPTRSARGVKMKSTLSAVCVLLLLLLLQLPVKVVVAATPQSHSSSVSPKLWSRQSFNNTVALGLRNVRCGSNTYCDGDSACCGPDDTSLGFCCDYNSSVCCGADKTDPDAGCCAFGYTCCGQYCCPPGSTCQNGACTSPAAGPYCIQGPMNFTVKTSEANTQGWQCETQTYQLTAAVGQPIQDIILLQEPGLGCWEGSISLTTSQAGDPADIGVTITMTPKGSGFFYQCTATVGNRSCSETHGSGWIRTRWSRLESVTIEPCS
jgi:hypothetical protein